MSFLMEECMLELAFPVKTWEFSKLFTSLSLCLGGGWHVWYVCPSVHMCKTETDIQCLPLLWSTVFFESGSSIELGAWFSCPGGMRSHVCPPHLALGVTHYHTWLFTWMLGI